MKELKGHQKNYLRGLAHSLRPVVLIGQGGLQDPVIKAIDEALEIHELIKIKFNEHKEKESKKDMALTIENNTNSQIVGIVGHTIIFFRQNIDPEKQKINFPKQSKNNKN